MSSWAIGGAGVFGIPAYLLTKSTSSESRLSHMALLDANAIVGLVRGLAPSSACDNAAAKFCSIAAKPAARYLAAASASIEDS